MSETEVGTAKKAMYTMRERERERWGGGGGGGRGGGLGIFLLDTVRKDLRVMGKTAELA